MDPLPQYSSLQAATAQLPPTYTPSIEHISLNFLYHESSTRPARRRNGFEPVLFEINSTQVNIYEIKPYARKFAKFYFHNLRPEYIDPELNIKSGRITCYQFEDWMKANERAQHNWATRLTKSLLHMKEDDGKCLSKAKLASHNCTMVHELLLYRPDLRKVTTAESHDMDESLNRIKGSRIHSFSLQELVNFGNAADFPYKPFTLRIQFPQDQFLITSYNSGVFVELYYKLNIARELSLDLDLRTEMPLDHSVPRRRRNRSHRSATVSTGFSSTISVDSMEGDDVSLFSQPLQLESTGASDWEDERVVSAKKQATSQSLRKDVEQYKELVYTIRCMRGLRSAH
ncbi:hypothetical protein OGAPHI_005508 [Ogataea philodendri]|uniref:Uncharacterized protein n=1 Tax=Ogataea philodendri TaxID=1378263 RepID=A0A9P8NZB5_9ASCO|nr:uncharacterized protein OGAPHI_005508 [Ogataea philodendri]KAH3662260.1 hypothetical protein OGAPHI_005508 [Ogataea philodendri]